MVFQEFSVDELRQCPLSREKMTSALMESNYLRENGLLSLEQCEELIVSMEKRPLIEAPTKKQMASMRKIVRKTFSLVEDYDRMVTILGSALTGRASLDQTMLFLLGDASSGKSNVLSLRGHRMNTLGSST
jgi:hypothetical protein